MSKEKEQLKEGKEPKRLPLQPKSFMANGNEYTIVDTMSIERWKYLEDFQELLAWGVGFDELFKQLKKIYTLLDENKQNEPRIIIHNLLHGVKNKLENRYHPALMLCTLFIVRKDEDQTVYDEMFMNEKVNDWKLEGYEINDFFQLAWTLVPGFIKHYQDDLADSLKTLSVQQLRDLNLNK